MVSLLIKKLNEQCPGNEHCQWYADEDGCREYIFLWCNGRTTIKIYPEPFAKMDDDGNTVVGVNWFITPEANTPEEMQTEEFKLASTIFRVKSKN